MDRHLSGPWSLATPESAESYSEKGETDPGVMRPRAAPKLDDKIGLVQAAGSHRWAEGGYGSWRPAIPLFGRCAGPLSGRREKQPHVSHEPSLSYLSREERKKEKLRAPQQRRRKAENAAPAGSGTARRRVRRGEDDGTRPTTPPDDPRTTLPRHLSRSTPSYTLSRFRFAFGVSQRWPLRLANGQDSSVRVSRRVGWVADARR